jgi:hypothetical protein
MPVRTVTIGLTVDGAEVPSGETVVSKAVAPTVVLTVTVDDTGINGDYTLPVRQPGKVLPLLLSFADGEASHTLAVGSLELGEHKMAADDVLDYLRVQYPNIAWAVTGGARVIIRA